MILFFLLSLNRKEFSLFDSWRSRKAKAASESCNIDLMGLKDTLEEVSSEVIEEGSISIESGSVEIITFIDKLPEFIVNSNELI